MNYRYPLVLLLASLLQSCSSNPAQEVSNYYSRQNLVAPITKNFTHCYGYGCRSRINISLTDKDWKRIEVPFQHKAENAQIEREKIRTAIAEFERIVGHIAGTDSDVRGSFVKLGRKQHDCVDESINTTTYMTLLQQNGLVEFHDIKAPSHRFLRNGLPGWPHQTATLIERETGAKFVVDSWFRDNGYPPFVVPLKTWRLGWQPDKAMLPEVYAGQ